MKKFVYIFLLITVSLFARGFNKHYIPIELVNLSGENIKHFEKKLFKNELNHQLKIYGLKLARYSNYKLKVKIKGFKPYNSSHDDYIEKKSTARYKGKIRVKVKFYEFLNTVYHSGDISAYYDVEKIGWSKHDAVIKTREYILKDLARQVAKEVTSHAEFLKKHYVPQHSVLEDKNNEILKTGESFDFDSGKKSSGYMSDDIKWKKSFGKDDIHILKVDNFAKCGIFKNLSYDDIDLNFIKDAKLSIRDITVFDYDDLLIKGDILLCKTSESNYVKAQILDLIPQNGSKKGILYFRWKLYKYR